MDHRSSKRPIIADDFRPSSERLQRAERRVQSMSSDRRVALYPQVSFRLAGLSHNQEGSKYRNLYALYFVLGDMVPHGRVAAE